jgi:hypothetical protein
MLRQWSRAKWGLDHAGAAGWEAGFLAFDSCVVGASCVFRGDMVETQDILIMVDSAGRRHESLHSQGLSLKHSIGRMTASLNSSSQVKSSLAFARSIYS